MKTKLNDLFDQIEPEKGNKLDKKIRVVDSETQELLNKLYQIDEKKFVKIYLEDRFDFIKQLVSKKYTSKQITQFSLNLTDKILNETLKENTGFFINCLIQRSDDREHLIYTTHLDSNLDDLGHQNVKDIKIIGNLGNYTGSYMTNGSIEITGNIGVLTGETMKGGNIAINGSPKADTGVRMQGGQIYLNGETIGQGVGFDMEKGEIYHKGRLIKSKGFPYLKK